MISSSFDDISRLFAKDNIFFSECIAEAFIRSDRIRTRNAARTVIADIDLVGISPDDGDFLDIAKRKYAVVFQQDRALARNLFCKHRMGLCTR